MELALIQTHTAPVIAEFLDKLASVNLLYYASETALDMDFDSMDELKESVKCAIDICLAAGIPIKGNFQRVYKCFDGQLTCDWKLSLLANKLVCINGSPSNPKVSRMVIKMIKDVHASQF